MTCRPFRASDEAILKAAYLQRGFAGDWRSMADVVSAFVIVDDNDDPVAMVAAHAIAELRASVDQVWQTPAWRQEALTIAHDAVLSDLKRKGYNRASALLEGEAGIGFGRKLQTIRGWFRSRGLAYEKGF